MVHPATLFGLVVLDFVLPRTAVFPAVCGPDDMAEEFQAYTGQPGYS